MSFLILIIQVILLDSIIVWEIKKIFPQFTSRHRKRFYKAFIIQAAVSALIIFIGYIFDHKVRDYRLFIWYYYLFGVVVVIYIPKSFYALFLFADWIISTINARKRTPDNSQKQKHIVSKAGFLVSLVVACFVVWGIVYGRYDFTVDHLEIVNDNVPAAFNGYKIVQISDIHAGSFVGNAHRFQKAVDLINQQEPDLIVFTGDMVNNFTEELTSMIPVFSQLNASDGKYAVLGNHDYGGYYDWGAPSDSAANHKALQNDIEQMGFVLLNNRSVTLTRDNSQIALIGIENWGTHKRYTKRGDLDKAMEHVHDIPFKLLLSHNPLFWFEHVKEKTDIALTLSGHTHGLQVGVKLGKKHYSAAILLRRQFHYWLGLYQAGRQYLYVNRGLGVIGFPGRVGMSPEITVVTLSNH